MKIRKEDSVKIRRLAESFKTSGLADVEFKNGKLRGPSFALKYIKANVGSNLTESRKNYLKKKFVFDEIDFFFERVGKTSFIYRDETGRPEQMRRRIKVVKPEDSLYFKERKNPTEKELSLLVRKMYSEGRGFGI